MHLPFSASYARIQKVNPRAPGSRYASEMREPAGAEGIFRMESPLAMGFLKKPRMRSGRDMQ